MLRHDLGHIIIDPIFASESYRDEVKDCFIAIDIDDCDCGHCEVDRGPIPKYATVSLGIVSGNVRVSQRLTIAELRELAETLNQFADVIDDVSEATKTAEEDLA
jgi:hypothetical protein